MKPSVKICGLTTPQSVSAAIECGAAYIGFVFFAKSPRNISPEDAAVLAQSIPESVKKIGVFVDPSDELLKEITDLAFLDILQLHGSESVERVTEVRARYDVAVIKAIAVASLDDLALARTYEDSADLLLFDAKAPKDFDTELPGGNGLSFDWQLIRGNEWKIPWMLSGGLNTDNIAEAIATSGASMVDVSSGVEDAPGIKSPIKIKNFLSAVKDET